MQILLKRMPRMQRSECHAGFVTCVAKGEADSMALLVARPCRRCCRPWWSVLALASLAMAPLSLSSIITRSTHFPLPPSQHHRSSPSQTLLRQPPILSPCSHSLNRPSRWHTVLFGDFWRSDRFITQGFDSAAAIWEEDM